MIVLVAVDKQNRLALPPALFSSLEEAKKKVSLTTNSILRWEKGKNISMFSWGDDTEVTEIVLNNTTLTVYLFPKT